MSVHQENVGKKATLSQQSVWAHDEPKPLKVTKQPPFLVKEVMYEHTLGRPSNTYRLFEERHDGSEQRRPEPKPQSLPRLTKR